MCICDLVRNANLQLGNTTVMVIIHFFKKIKVHSALI